MSNIELYTLLNDNYMEVGQVMIYSFLYNNQWFDGDIVILCDNGERCGLSEYNRNRLRAMYNSIIFYEINPRDYDKVVENIVKNGGNPAYSMLVYKLEIFKKNGFNRKVFLDADVVVNANIRELFYNNKKTLIAVEDGLKPLSDYFNSGVMSLPMDYIDNTAFSKMIDLAENFNKHSFTNPCSNMGISIDQDIINEVIKEVTLIGAEYNFSPYYCKGDIDTIKIFHYYGGAKPWLEHCDFLEGYLPYYRYYYAMIHNFRKK